MLQGHAKIDVKGMFQRAAASQSAGIASSSPQQSAASAFSGAQPTPSTHGAIIHLSQQLVLSALLQALPNIKMLYSDACLSMAWQHVIVL